MKRAKIEITQPGVVRVTSESGTDIYFVAGNPGYVHLLTADGRNPQVCVGLSSRGNTLRSTPAGLRDLVRRERRRQR